MTSQVLPDEILRKVAHSLPQKSLLKLAYASKRMFAIIIPELYQHVLVDSSNRVFDASQGLGLVEEHSPTGRPPVVVRSLYALTRFFRNLMLYPIYGGYLQYFELRRLPDIPQYELDYFLEGIFPSLSNLVLLKCYSEQAPLNLKHLLLLPNFERLSILCGNFMFEDPDSATIPAASSLRHLDISNFGSYKVLRNIDTKDFSRLETLKLARLLSRSKPSLTILTSTDMFRDSRYYCPADYLLSFFNSILNPLTLRALTLSDLTLSLLDVKILSNSVNLASLVLLSLVNCLELFESDQSYSGDIQIVQRTLIADSFFRLLSQNLKSLQLLHYDLRNNFCEDFTVFSSICQIQSLKQLTVCLYLRRRRDPVDLSLFVNYLQPRATALERLDLACKVIEPNGPIFLGQRQVVYIKSLRALASFYNLRILSIPVTKDQLHEVGDVLPEKVKVLRLGVTDQLRLSTSSCHGCNNEIAYNVYNSTCLISHEYFSCPISFSAEVKDTYDRRYLRISDRYRKQKKNLEFVRFDFKILSMLFDCRRLRIELKDPLFLHQFDALVDRSLA